MYSRDMFYKISIVAIFGALHDLTLICLETAGEATGRISLLRSTLRPVA